MKNYIFGIHAINAILQTQPQRITHLFTQQGRSDKRLQELCDLAKQNGVSMQGLSKPELTERCGSEQHQGVVAECQESKALNENDLDDMLASLNEPAFLLVLDGVTDPHNLGAILRSADAAGVHAVIATKDKAVGLTPAVRKVACGAAETMPFVQVTNLARTMKQLQEQGVWLYGTSDKAKQNLYQTNLTGPIALVMGAEGKGLRHLTGEKCDHLVSLPMAGSVSSLNVSVATGVCLFEIVRQRMASLK
tara:strand:- start:39772 stop:40518 length:747 start_codon:yes stop_codon:yes gene_type:complete